MLANDRFLFLHFPKTAGKSMAKYFIEAWDKPVFGRVSSGQIDELRHGATEGVTLEVGRGHEDMRMAEELLNAQGKSTRDLSAVFVGIRNPYDMAVSTYFYLRETHRLHADKSRYQMAMDLDFETFWCSDGPSLTSPPERWLTLDGEVLPNLRLVRFESIEDDLARFAHEFGFNAARLPHLNSTEHEHYSAYLTPKAEEAIFARFRHFFDAGYYPRERVPRKLGSRLSSLRIRKRNAPTPSSTVPATGDDITAALQSSIDNAAPGQVVQLPVGSFTLSETIKLRSGITLQGNAGRRRTSLTLAPDTNGHMFTNISHQQGNARIVLKDLILRGNAKHQHKPDGMKRLVWCNLILFRRVKDATVSNITAYDCRQTVLHLNHCTDVSVDGLECHDMGWSAISTSHADNLTVRNSSFHNSGLDTMHSAVHLDGGSGAQIHCTVDTCTGNGVMLDSKFSPLQNVVVEATCRRCLRGIGLMGDHENRIRNVLLRRCEVDENKVGMVVSNTSHVFIDNCAIRDSQEAGLVLQGQHGGRNVVVSGCHFERNLVDVQERHTSKDNHFVDNNVHFIPKRPPPRHDSKVVDSYTAPCTVCGSVSEFVHHGGSVRESYRCKVCRASLRHRGQANAIVEIFGKGERSLSALAQSPSFRDLCIYEPGLVGPFRKYLERLPNYMQSYLWDDLPLGASKDGIQNQDLEDLRMESSSVDLVITSDIFEHIRHPYRGFSELHRVLRVGGHHIFTVPLQHPMGSKTVSRVDTSGDQDVFLLEPRYHIAGDGGKSLVYTDFGEDMLARLEEIGLSTKLSFIDKDRPLCAKNITFVSTKTRA